METKPGNYSDLAGTSAVVTGGSHGVGSGSQGDPISIGDLDLDAWKAGIDVNLTSAFLTLREFVPSMAERRSGAVVTMASTAGRIASPSSPAYAAGKAGLIMLSRQTALQVAAAGVRVNVIALGPVF